jgi:hypothetical protein
LYFYLKSSGVITATVYNNLISGSTVEAGVLIASQSASTFTGSFYNNTVKNNGNYGVWVGKSGYTNAVTADFGGGALGSIGHNSIYGNSLYDMINQTVGPVTAQHNWWGSATPLDSQFSESLPLGTIDHTNPLSSDPN